MPLGLLPASFRREAEISRSGLSSAPASAPPAGFYEAKEVRAAWPMPRGPFARTSARGGTPAQRAGKRYEKKVSGFLSNALGPDFSDHPWFRYASPEGTRWCQPDGLLLSEPFNILFEIKYSFTPDAWWQMRRLYEPVVRKAFLLKRLSLVLICKKYDPAVSFPEPTEVLPDLPRVEEWARGGDTKQVGVLQWMP